MPDMRALALAPAARDWLARAARPGAAAPRVLSAFDRACNLVDAEGNVLALVTAERGMTPFGLEVETAARFSQLAPGSPAQVTDEYLLLGPLRIALGGARLWNPRPDWPALRQWAAHPANVDGLLTLAHAEGKPGSLLEVVVPVPDLAQAGRGEAQVGSAHALATQRVRAGAAHLVAGLAAASLERCRSGVQALAGLGGGLTPAGDDFIVGVLLAAWAGLGAAERALPLAPVVAAEAASRTTTLSAAYLHAAARGECAAPWHALFAALLRAKPAETLRALRRLLAVGHTSGADGLAGFLAVHTLRAQALADKHLADRHV